MTPPSGLFVIARLDGDAVGCGGFKRVDKATGEIKRVWTAPSARGMGVARRMLRTLEAAAREAGLKTLRLDTNRALTEAHALYRQRRLPGNRPLQRQPLRPSLVREAALKRVRSTTPALSAPARLVDFRPAFGRRDANVVQLRLRHSRELVSFPLAPAPQLQRASPAGETWRRWSERDMRQCDPQHVILLGDWRP